MHDIYLMQNIYLFDVKWKSYKLLSSSFTKFIAKCEMLNCKNSVLHICWKNFSFHLVWLFSIFFLMLKSLSCNMFLSPEILSNKKRLCSFRPLRQNAPEDKFSDKKSCRDFLSFYKQNNALSNFKVFSFPF